MEKKHSEVLQPEYEWMKTRTDILDEYGIPFYTLDNMIKKGLVDYFRLGTTITVLGSRMTINLLEGKKKKRQQKGKVDLPDPKPHSREQIVSLKACNLEQLIRYG